MSSQLGFILFLKDMLFRLHYSINKYNILCCCTTVPLFSEFAIFLPVCSAEAEQRLQAISVGLYILIVYIYIIQILLLLKDLLSST